MSGPQIDDRDTARIARVRHSPQRDGRWIMTFTGRCFWPLDPRPEDVDLVDIAHALSMKCRYGGHSNRFYSVAQHALLVALMVEEECTRNGYAPRDAARLALWGLHHDDAEAYLPDVCAPIKPSLPGFREIEAGVMAAVCSHFGLSLPEPPVVKRIDRAILWDEAHALLPRRRLHLWTFAERGLGINIDPVAPEVARALFMQCHHALLKAAER